MSYDDNKIRRRKVSSSTSISKPLPNDNINDRKKETKEVNEIKREKNYEMKNRYKSKSRTNKKSKIKKENTWKIVKSLLVIMLVGLITVSAVGSVVLFSAIKDSPKISKELIDSKYISSEPVSIAEMPINLKNALVSIEDERFYKHKGVDFISLTRSVLHNLFTETTQGGSTIDMQVSKNLLTSDDKTIKRKIRDIYNALQMNKVMSKDEIIEAYLNNMYLGKSTYGVGKGAKVYFGKNVKDLTLAQCAMLVGITNNPARYMEHSEAKKRQETVLYKMHELGYITDAEYKSALKEEVPFVSEIG